MQVKFADVSSDSIKWSEYKELSFVLAIVYLFAFKNFYFRNPYSNVFLLRQTANYLQYLSDDISASMRLKLTLNQ